MPNDALRLYVYCMDFSEASMKDVQQTVEDYRFSIYDSYEGYTGEITYLTQAFSSSQENLKRVDQLESELRSEFADREIERDEKNVSQQAPGIEGVSYVTGITIHPS